MDELIGEGSPGLIRAAKESLSAIPSSDVDGLVLFAGRKAQIL